MEISASMEGAGGLGYGKLRVTSDRLVFERKKLFGGSGDIASFPLSSIQTAGISGRVDKKLKVRSGSTELVFASTNHTELQSISNLLQRRIASYPSNSSVQAPSGPSSSPASTAPSATWLDQLQDLAKLHSIGALTDDEFAQAKRKLLETP